MNSVIVGGCSQENIGVRRQSCRIMSKGSREENASFSKAVDMRSFGIFAPITAQPVCSQSINSDQKKILLRLLLFQRIKRRCCENCAEKDRQEYKKAMKTDFFPYDFYLSLSKNFFFGLSLGILRYPVCCWYIL